MQIILGYSGLGLVSIAVFVTLLITCLRLLNKVPLRYTVDTGKQEIDHRAVNFTLRLALTFGIGAIIAGLFLIAALFLFVRVLV